MIAVSGYPFDKAMTNIRSIWSVYLHSRQGRWYSGVDRSDIGLAEEMLTATGDAGYLAVPKGSKIK
jgi:hypothetical protein